MNLIEALESRGIEYREHQSKENEIFICCPFCVENGTTPDTRFRLGINVVTGWMKCFNGGCDKGSRDADYTWKELQRVFDMGKLSAASALVRKTQKRVSEVRLPEDFEILSKSNPEYWGRKAYRYLKNRGVPDWQMKERKIGYSLMDEFRYRIVFPVESRGKLHGLVARTFLKGVEPRYRNSVGGKVLYGLPDEMEAEDALVVEGVLDCLSADRCTRNFRDCNFDSCASLSTALTPRQIKQLKRYKTVTVWYDPDPTGLKGTVRVTKALRQQEMDVWVVLPELNGVMETRDTGKMSMEDVRYRWKRRVPYTEEIESRFRTWKAFLEE